MALFVLVVLVSIGGVLVSMLPTSAKQALAHPDLTTFTTNNFLRVRLMSLCWDHANGMSQRQTLLLNALRAAASYDHIKDWQTTEQNNASSYLMYLLAYAQEFVAQRNIRLVAPQYCAAFGDDSKCVWTDATWENFVRLHSSLALPFLPQVVELVERMNPVVRCADENATRNIPSASLLYWIPSKTSTEMFALRSTLLGLIEGVNWLKKVQIEFSAGGLPLFLAAGPKLLSVLPITPEFLFWFAESQLVVDNGGTHSVKSSFGSDPYDGNIASTVYHFIPGVDPYPLYGLKAIMSRYHATNNPLGIVVDGSTTNNMPGVTYANDKIHMALIALTGNATSISLMDKADLPKLQRYFLCALANTNSANDHYSSAFNGYWFQTTSNVVWSTAAENTITGIFQARHGPVIDKQRQKGSKKGQGGKRYGQKRKGRYRRPKKTRDNREAKI